MGCELSEKMKKYFDVLPRNSRESDQVENADIQPHMNNGKPMANCDRATMFRLPTSTSRKVIVRIAATEVAAIASDMTIEFRNFLVCHAVADY